MERLEAIADELYGLAPDEFVAARTARVAELRQTGDSELAAAVKALGRPTTAAWLANRLVRERRNDVGRLLDLGASMREAQARLAGEDLRQLSRQRHEIVRALGVEARKLAVDTGTPISKDVERQLGSTLEAALVDDAGSDALRAGHLKKALQFSGFAASDMADAVAAPLAPRPAADRAGKAKAEAEEALGTAERDAAQAQHLAEERKGILEETRARHQRLDRSVKDLEDRLDELRSEMAEAAEQVRAAQEASDQADRATETAGERVAKEQGRVDRLRS